MATLDATAIYVGGTAATALYVGGAVAWSDAPTYDELVLADAPVLYLPLTTDANDLSGNAIHGTPVGSPVFGAQGVEFTAGKYITLPADARLRPTTALTMEAWITPTTISSNHCLWVGSDNPYENWLIQGATNTDGRVRVQTDTNPAGNQADVTSVAGTIHAGTRYHLAWVFTGTTITIYRNGVSLVGPQNTLGGPLEWNTAGQRLGARMNGAEQYLGSMQRFAMYPTALTGAQITAHYEAGAA